MAAIANMSGHGAARTLKGRFSGGKSPCGPSRGVLMSTETAPSTTSAEPWLAALHASSARLAAAVSGLRDEQLARPSFAKDWSIAQVLSHLGSAAENSTTLVERGIAGDNAVPRREDMEPVWHRWNALTGPEQ